MNLVHVTTRNIGMNPVARAIARQKLRDAVPVFQTRLHMLEEGEDVASDADALMSSISITMRGLEMLGRSDIPEYRQMKSAVKVLSECALRGFKWRCADAPTMDAALSRVLDIYPSLPAEVANRAWTEHMQARDRAGRAG